jgi:hypothetical protein
MIAILGRISFPFVFFWHYALIDARVKPMGAATRPRARTIPSWIIPNEWVYGIPLIGADTMGAP